MPDIETADDGHKLRNALSLIDPERRPSFNVRASFSSKHRGSVNPRIDILRRQREALLHQSHEAAESERLRKQIETLEREDRHVEKHEKEQHKAKKEKAKDLGVKFFVRPKIRAYFHGSQLFQSQGDHEYAATTSISLFTDLLYVGVLAETGDLIGDNGESLIRFIVLFLPSWRIWCYIRDIVAIYEMNAVSQRFLILWILALLIGFTIKSSL
jgi:hypothetical protein